MIRSMLFDSQTICLKGECIISFRTIESGRNLLFEFETDERDYDSVYRLKCKKTYSIREEKDSYFVQARRIY